MPRRDSDEDEEIRDVEEVESKRPRSLQVRHNDEDLEEDEGVDVVETMIPYRNGLALGAYYCGVFGFIPILGFMLAPMAIVLGFLGLRHSRKHTNARGGGHAIAGIILGIVAIPWNIGCIYFLVSRS
jgi:hypothetical protein